MKKTLGTTLLVAAITLVGCSAESEELDTSVNAQQKVEDDAGSAQASVGAEKALSQSKQVVVDDDDIKITFEKAVYTSDALLGESVKFIFEFENKTDIALSLISDNDASVDGIMIDDLAGFGNPDVTAGKTGQVILEFNSQWLDHDIGQKFPKFEDNMEITLRVFDEMDYEYEELFPFSVEF